MKALIVDDSAVMRKVVERAIRHAGFGVEEVAEAANGQEALDLLRADGESFGLILSDIHMPVMDGLAFVEAVKREKLATHAPVVMITTEEGVAQVLRAITAGAKGYICKPFTADQVKSRIQPLLRKAA